MRRLLLLVCAAVALLGLPSPAAASHGIDLDCAGFANQAAAQSHLAAHPGDPDRLDGDADGRACDASPCPCAGATAPPPAPAPAPVAPPPPADPPASAGVAQTARARVVRVIDGDTLKVRLTSGKTVTVRLLGIDTPEAPKPATRGECGALDATARMKKVALRNGVGRMVTLKTDPTQDRVDRYDRLLAYVSAGGVDFGHTMISSGWAKVYVFRREFQRVSSYRRAQASARAAGRGVVRKCGGDVHRG